MQKPAVVVVSAASLLLPLGIALAGPAVAEPAPTTTTKPAPTYVMPSVTGGTLANADDAVTALSPTTAFQVTPSVKGGEPVQVLSPGSWEVCRQSPAAGRKINAKTKITLTVERPWYGC
ncbi:PASTA domain-containing protein [Mycolicibacterium mengxianglii]|uniref:PASTA domain-containing protein n=1 Tax=Mycolicibacterium mengxianglii TaxID=2736649 RepID=UPI0018D1C64A|nr:PASTA domain-containing protein [Mycolicibacterium mengxianglii]